MVFNFKDALLFSEITRYVLCFHSVFMFMFFLIFGPSEIINVKSFLLILLLNFVLFLALSKCNERVISQILALSWFIVLFFQMRLTEFLVIPKDKILFPAIDPLNAQEIASGLTYIILGTMFIIFGFITGDKLTRGVFSKKIKKLNIFRIEVIIIYWALCYFAAIYAGLCLELNLYSDPSHWGSRMGWIVIAFDTDIALLITITWAALNRELSKREKITVCILIAIWIFYSLLKGSRGGPLRILFILFFANLAINGNFRITLKKLASIIILFLVMNYLTFPIGTAIRYHLGGIGDPTSQMQNDWDGKQKGYFASIFQRMGLIDYAIIISSRNADPEIINKYINSQYPLQNFANNLVPGEIFPESDVMTSRVFTRAYRGASEEHIRTHFLSEPWLIWGYSWLSAGFTGGLFLMLIWGALMQCGYNFLSIIPGQYSPYAIVSFSLFIFFNGLEMFGIDHWLTVAAHSSGALMISLIIMWSADMILNKIALTNGIPKRVHSYFREDFHKKAAHQ